MQRVEQLGIRLLRDRVRRLVRVPETEDGLPVKGGRRPGGSEEGDRGDRCRRRGGLSHLVQWLTTMIGVDCEIVEEVVDCSLCYIHDCPLIPDRGISRMETTTTTS